MRYWAGMTFSKKPSIRRFWARNLRIKVAPAAVETDVPLLAGPSAAVRSKPQTFFPSKRRRRCESFLFAFATVGTYRQVEVALFRRLPGRDTANSTQLESLRRNLPDEFQSWPHFSQGQYLEATYFLAGYLLSSQGDRMAMAHSVEGRYPFLDYRVVSSQQNYHRT